MREHRRAPLLEGVDHVDDVLGGKHVDARIGLVENSKPGVQGKDGCKFDPLPLAAAQGFIDHSAEVERRVQSDQLEKRSRISVSALQGKVITHGNAFESDRLLPRHGDAEPRPFVDLQVVDARTIEAYLAREGQYPSHPMMR